MVRFHDSTPSSQILKTGTGNGQGLPGGIWVNRRKNIQDLPYMVGKVNMTGGKKGKGGPEINSVPKG